MRTLLLGAFALALLIAGCLQSYQAPDSQAPTSPSTTGGGQGIAPGEPNPSGPGGGAAIRPPSGHNETAGLAIDGSADRSGAVSGGVVTFSFTATNTGADARVE